MRILTSLLSLSFALGLSACVDSDTDSPESERGRNANKADHIGGTCEGATCEPGSQSSTGNCFCDEGCLSFGDCCADRVDFCAGAEPTTQNACEAAGGSCVVDPIFPTEPRSCDELFGVPSLAASCDFFNELCCDLDGDKPEPSSCEAAGGSCITDPIFPTEPRSCQELLGVPSVDGTCGAFNELCCAQ